jgi:hypothetical protein
LTTPSGYIQMAVVKVESGMAIFMVDCGCLDLLRHLRQTFVFFGKSRLGLR